MAITNVTAIITEDSMYLWQATIFYSHMLPQDLPQYSAGG